MLVLVEFGALPVSHPGVPSWKAEVRENRCKWPLPSTIESRRLTGSWFSGVWAESNLYEKISWYARLVSPSSIAQGMLSHPFQDSRCSSTRAPAIHQGLNTRERFRPCRHVSFPDSEEVRFKQGAGVVEFGSIAVAAAFGPKLSQCRKYGRHKHNSSSARPWLLQTALLSSRIVCVWCCWSTAEILMQPDSNHVPTSSASGFIDSRDKDKLFQGQ